MKSILLKTVLMTLACGAFVGCEPEYPKRKKIAEIEAPAGDKTGDEDDVYVPPVNNGPVVDDGDTEPGDSDVVPGGEDDTPVVDDKKNDGTQPNKNDNSVGPSKTTAVKNIFICKNTALISPISGRTNCFLKKGTSIAVNTAKIMTGNFVSVSIPAKVEGCTMQDGYFYSKHVSDKSSCDGSITADN